MKFLSFGFFIASLLLPAWANAEGEHKHDHMHHGQIETAELDAIPGITLEVLQDSSAGWNLHLITENFSFAPQNVNESHVNNEGHSHVYVDGKKISRVYGPWFHLTGLTPGKHSIRVSLNANDHSEYVLNGKEIESIIEIIQE